MTATSPTNLAHQPRPFDPRPEVAGSQPRPTNLAPLREKGGGRGLVWRGVIDPPDRGRGWAKKT